MGEQKECRCCGVCCEKGGPALHVQDLPLIRDRHLVYGQLITLRRGELAHDPVSDSIQPLAGEVVKIRGTRGTWQCCFYDRVKKGCLVYLVRPHACRILRCWDTEEILSIAGRELLSRLDIIAADSAIRASVPEHERRFPCPSLALLSQGQVRIPPGEMRVLEDMVNDEMGFRLDQVALFDLSVAEELFYFGRPLFQLLQSVGFEVRELSGSRVMLSQRPEPA